MGIYSGKAVGRSSGGTGFVASSGVFTREKENPAESTYITCHDHLPPLHAWIFFLTDCMHAPAQK